MVPGLRVIAPRTPNSSGCRAILSEKTRASRTIGRSCRVKPSMFVTARFRSLFFRLRVTTTLTQ